MDRQRLASRLRNLHLRNRHLLRWATAGLVVIFVGVLAAQAGPRPLPTPGASFPTFPAGTATPGTPAPGTSATPENWTPVSLEPYNPAADLVASRTDSSGVARDAVLALRSRTAVPALALAKGLTVTPAVRLVASAGKTADVAVIRPAKPLAEGTRYRFRLTGVDGALLGAWTFRVAGPLHVTGLLPANRTTSVPTSTGIEVTFDQDNPVDFASHFSIKPAVKGRFELHDRTWVFVPATRLQAGTVYTYTVQAGVGKAGSDQTLEKAVSATFETAAAGATEPRVVFDRALFEVRVGTRAALGLWAERLDQESETTLTSLLTEVYRLPTLDAAAAAVARLTTQSEWAEVSRYGLVSTTGLTRVARFEAHLTDPSDGTYVLHAPVTLDAGWYLVVIPRHGRDAQAVVEVTDLAAYGLSSNTRTVVWLNDLGTGAAVAGATVRTAKGISLGQTDASGLLDARTPGELLVGTDSWTADAAVLTVRTTDGRAVVVPLGMSSEHHYPYNRTWSWEEPAPWWTVLDTDRLTYRTTDTIHVWGLVRSRDDRAVPSDLELRLIAPGGDARAPIARQAVSATARGTYMGDLRLQDAPTDCCYEVRVYAGGQLVGARQVQVADIRKPAFAIDIATDHRAYLAGDKINVTASVHFFDGTTTPGLELTLGTWDWENHRVVGSGAVPTDSRGSITQILTARASEPTGWHWQDIVAAPSHPEEGEIRGESSVVVFPSSVWLTTTGSLTGDRLRLSGTLAKVDLAKVERSIEAGDEIDPAGAPIAGRSVTIQVIDRIPVRHLVRTDYDYVNKQAVPVYEYDFRDQSLGTHTLQSDANGRYTFTMTVPSTDHAYRAVVRARDSQDRVVEDEVWLDSSLFAWRPFTDLALDVPEQASIGQAIDATVHAPDGTVPAGRYLFVVARDGIREATVREAGSLQDTFRESDLPGYTLLAVRWSGIGLEELDTRGVLATPSEKEIHVTLSPDRTRYEPGDQVTVEVRTTGPDGSPIAADVVVRAVDQKLFAIGAAEEPGTLDELMRFVGSGFRQSYIAEFAPRPPASMGDGRGASGGDGGDIRTDFRDVLTFQRVSTDSAGRGSVRFDLSDDLTSWHVSATAFGSHLESGDTFVLVPVGLPFFVEATLAPTYLTGEQPVLRLRAYGEAITAGDAVTFTVASPSMGLAPTTVNGKAFEAVRVSLPALPAGNHPITIEGRRVGSTTVADKLVRSVHVIPNRLTALRTSYQDLDGSLSPTVGVAMTTYLVTDAGRGALVPVLNDLASASGARFEQLAAAEAARAILTTAFGMSLDLPPTGFDATRYQSSEGIAILPYASPDLALGAEAALTVPERVDRAALRNVFRNVVDSGRYPDKNGEVTLPTREDAIIAAAGLAALGDDVLDDLRAAAQTEPALGVREQLWLALGYLASGDEAAARTIERDLLATRGQQVGPWVRLNVSGIPDEANGLMLLLAGQLGDPIATRIARYVADHPSKERSFALEQVGYAAAMLDWLPRSAASFAWTVDGQRHVETLDPGASFSLALTPSQQRSLSFERISGALLVATSATVAATPADLTNDGSVSISRTVTPADNASETQLVHVSLSLSFTRVETAGCYTLTDILPSGLAPVASEAGWPADYADPETPRNALWPSLIDGQRVSWCTGHDAPTLVYTARVVSPGTYTWEPAVVQFEADASIGGSTATTTYTIK